MSEFAKVRGHSVRTLAWLGDAEYEREVRLRLACSGDWPTDQLDRLRARFSSAAFQAQLFGEIEVLLHEDELALARRARNANVRSNGRIARDVKTYRQATAFESLLARWLLGEADQRQRFVELVAPRLQSAIDAAVQGLRTAKTMAQEP